ncbi:hypothetical protein BDP55DRAFT_678661 [Colletotrichum godetiae]|uniref:Uncharacterized protein n=1 Tax=Colletotrichum godetiae TaxID=1209918 RepID=A0AAJ0ESS4_9PEZI|nr:uncharacterized protein BDP55DRAFT_678661 [Colletotrichum godetiae]KAK1659839.1 hypothetical protein BDP55DRAFT_678661 [Colletotrichum godetiae]
MLRVSLCHACTAILLSVACAYGAPLNRLPYFSYPRFSFAAGWDSKTCLSIRKRQDGSVINRELPAGRRKGDSVCHTISRTSCPTRYDAFGEAESWERSALFNGMNVQIESSGTVNFPVSLYGP